MCNESGIAFARVQLAPADINGRNVLEVGSYDMNGSVRPWLESLGPARYLGVDIVRGPSVDEICDVRDLISRFGSQSFDIVVSTEMLEHVRDWRTAVHNLKAVLRPNGILLVTTRSRGFPYHAGPHDFWRYEIEDMRSIFGDMHIGALEPDPVNPGVFLRATKPSVFVEVDLSQVELYSMVIERRTRTISDMAVLRSRFATPPRAASSLLPEPVKRLIRRLLPGLPPVR